jgi:pimeloyl-ACP methyl ester carboxylesterase
MPFLTIPPGRIEYQRIEPGKPDSPTYVLLHEGLGSVAMWKDFPAQLAALTQSSVIVYSRHGYGRSSLAERPRGVRYLHDEALNVLPQLLHLLGVDRPILFGHSDGASIALIYAGATPEAVAGIVALAPHVMVEDVSLASIAAARTGYQTSNLRTRLARYHADVDGAFWGWNDIWLDPRFRSWNIEEYLPRIDCPILVIQGEKDEYGTMEQVERISRAASIVDVVKLAHCGHSPHRDQPDDVLKAVAEWAGARLPMQRTARQFHAQ